MQAPSSSKGVNPLGEERLTAIFPVDQLYPIVGNFGYTLSSGLKYDSSQSEYEHYIEKYDFTGSDRF